ncbi:unnamed protein product [Thlaspi arvense]|uniref:Glycosyltransferase n=1 Tax=Thlaspi arvense TaxID=13288 RepID=A0AAU9RGU4_THLAR|nr:unnamed protein product [Thlaspi arvense]
MANEGRKLTILFLPYFSASHMVALVDTARLFAARGVTAIIITTTGNAGLFEASVRHDTAAGHEISVRALKFPAAEVGLPEGIENFSQCIPSMSRNLYNGIALLQKPMEQLIREIRPDCIVSDMFHPWTVDLAEELKIPRVIVYPCLAFPRCVYDSLKVHEPHKKVQSETEDFLIPGLPDKIHMARSELEEHLKTKSSPYGDWFDSAIEAEHRSYGVIFGSFYELEPSYIDHFKKSTGVNCWSLGPLSLFANKGKIGNENNSETKRHHCLSWLDTQKPNSVLYTCFGGMVRFSDSQLTQLALALESASYPFVLVVRREEEAEENWLLEEFEEKIVKSNRGVIIKGWAPQVQILDHPAIAGFLSHGGGNSVIESMIAGLPLILWPMYAEHFYNSKLVTQVLKIGVEIGPRVWNMTFDLTSPVVEKEEFVKAIKFLMGGSHEAKQMRQRAKDFEMKAKKAIEEGGSSDRDLIAIIEDLKRCTFG